MGICTGFRAVITITQKLARESAGPGSPRRCARAL